MRLRGGIRRPYRPRSSINYKGQPQKAGLGPKRSNLKGGLTGAGFAPPGGGAAQYSPPVGSPTDAAYESNVNALQTRLNNTNTALTGQESQVRQSYGFDPEYASNPFTKANMLARAAQQRFTGSTNAMASRGQLYSGALNNARATDQFTSDAQMNDARNAYAQALTDIENRRLAAQTDFTTGKSEAYVSLLDRLTQATPDPSVQPTPDYPNDYPSYASPNKSKKKGKKKK